MNEFFSSYWTDISQFFSNSQQRLFWGYLLCAFFIALLWSIKNRRTNLTKNLTQAFGLKHILTRSCLADLQLIIINKAIFLVLLPILITKLAIATSIFELLHYRFSPPGQLESTIPTWLVISIFTLFVFLLDDFARFYLHKKMHQIPWLWEFHKTHHSATSLTPLTVLRTHPVEALIFAIRSAVVQGTSIGVFVYFFADQVDLFTVLKVNIFIFLFNVAGANLRHSHISFRYWRWLESILISPAQHQIHHSTRPIHFNKNYGAMLALWDKWAKTLHYSSSQPVDFGLHTNQQKKQHGLYCLYISAFVAIYKSCIRSVQKIRKKVQKSEFFS
ncbi:MAG: hypothetical protein OFPII_26830 [Osedax symbiont Rs1]|nr:MAG: hypothetical protein OFPII_26830 [Osedax symbiont Rs1]